MNVALLIPVLPLIGFLINGLFGKKLSKSLVGLIGSTAIFAAFVCVLITFANFVSGGMEVQYVTAFEWFKIGNTTLSMSFQIDQLH